MAVAKWSGVLSTTEPRNDVGIIKVRQGNVNSELVEFQIIQNNKPYDLTGLTVYFCASFGLNLVEKPAVVVNNTGGRIQYTFDDDSMQAVGRQKGYFSIKQEESKIDSTQDFEFQVDSSLMSRSIDGKSYIYKLSNLLKLLDDFIKNGQSNFNVWFESVKEILYGIDPGGNILRELIEARKTSDGSIFANLKSRLDKNEDDTTAQFAQTEDIIIRLKDDIGVNISDFPRIHPEITDAGRFNRAIATLENVNYPDIGWGSGSTNYLIVPQGDYKLTTTILIPAHFVMIGVGMPSVEQLTSGIAHFSTDLSKTFALNNIYISGMSFFKGSHAFVFQNHNEDNSQIVISRCQFHKTTDYAIYTWADTGDNHQSTQIKIELSKFMNCNGVLYNVCDIAVIDFSWFYIDKSTFSPNRPVFVNKNEQRRMTIENSVGVPTMGTGAERVAKVRWVDNWGHFRAYNTRFGGEDNGIPILYQYAGNSVESNTPNFNTSIIMRDSHLSSGEPPYQGDVSVEDSGVIRLVGNKIPPIISLEGNSYIIGVPYISVPSTFNVSSYLNGFLEHFEFFDISIKTNAVINTDVGAVELNKWPKAMDRIVNKAENRFEGLMTKSFTAQGTGTGTGIMYLDFEFLIVEKIAISSISFYGDPNKPTNVVLNKVNDQLYYVTFNQTGFNSGTTKVGTIELILT
ncbi:prophage pi2 protein 45 [Carnobacterium sp. AT7]|uniref:phage baseplate upper protein n=1 Tax=Carnobacterium sp. AT7 TaxID=333990 RepID=UPI00015F0331|nr:phage baseplate upper protein [Carnobacterium sp. AT7]EDP67301.1 prophage pi2 protein 45 [Carnobacterium sp. AT7]